MQRETKKKLKLKRSTELLRKEPTIKSFFYIMERNSYSTLIVKKCNMMKSIFSHFYETIGKSTLGFQPPNSSNIRKKE